MIASGLWVSPNLDLSFPRTSFIKFQVMNEEITLAVWFNK